jgi:2-keto-4-pentenoate hydratase/2-oxohepta-3-ene-1,7-dioic acid hydratase in catechol pathway
VAIGPCVLTADEIDPQTVFVTVRVDGDQWAKGNLNGTARNLLDEVAAASRLEGLEPGETFAACPLDVPELDNRIWPGAEIELEAEGIGVLRNRIDRQG